MNSIPTLRSLVLAPVLVFAAATGVQSAPQDYAFKIIGGTLLPGDGVTISVSLTDLRTNMPVADAVIFTTRLDMSPDGMEGMTAPVEALPSKIPGEYRFQVDLAMAGNWRFQIAAKVQGEAETVQGALILGVQK